MEVEPTRQEVTGEVTSEEMVAFHTKSSLGFRGVAKLSALVALRPCSA